MKICIWTTSLQADTLALAIALDRDPEVELLVVAAGLEGYRREPIARFRPLQCRLLDRSDEGLESILRTFDADIVFADNHLPKIAAGRKLAFHWHGVPIKVRPPRDIRSFRRRSKRLVGRVTRPNDRFLAQCYGEVDYRHRIDHWGLARENCRIWGSAYSDLLLAPPYGRGDLEDYYHLEVGSRKNILVSLTWNFGSRAFSELGDDDEIFDALLRTAAEHDANLVFSMHDRYRYTPELIGRVETYAAKYPRSFIKFKNEHPDNLADLVISDVMICNFSSFIVFHYFTGKPSIHIRPVDPKKLFVGLPTIKGGRLRAVFRRNNHRLWIYPFEDNGGCLPRDKAELIRDLERSLEDSAYCRDKAQGFIDDKIFEPDGNTSARIVDDLKQWVA